tara:strand:+ start:2845 stop:3387 length:543 start_codon:yes stop_codon:yes gene_type:complete
MLKNIKTGLLALSTSILFELIILNQFKESNFQISFIAFAFHSLNLILFILYGILYSDPVKSRITNFKKGLTISIVFSFFISFYFFSYHKWINPSFLENKKQELMDMALSEQTFISAETKIKEDPDYYSGKSAEDLIDMQQENINEFLQPSKVFPISLFGFLLIGMMFTVIVTISNHILNK